MSSPRRNSDPSPAGPGQQIAKAVAWLKQNFVQPLRGTSGERKSTGCRPRGFENEAILAAGVAARIDLLMRDRKMTPVPAALPQAGSRPGPQPGPHTGPHTTPLPVVAESAASARDSVPAADPADALFGASPAPAGDGLFAAAVPAISELDVPARPRGPSAGGRRGPVDITETTPIFAEIASAWFASDRPVPVDWELGERPDDDLVPASAPAPAPPAGSIRAGLLDGPDLPVPVPATDPNGQAFATVADEGWRAASGAAAERPDELTAAGLPKRRPRARLVPGSAGSAVLAAPASPTRSAESVRGRLASYQQGVSQGREIRLRRDPGNTGSQSVTPEDDTAVTGSGGHDEETR